MAGKPQITGYGRQKGKAAIHNKEVLSIVSMFHATA